MLNSYGSSSLDYDRILNAPSYNTVPDVYFYGISDFEDVGKGIAKSFCDLNLVNPNSRLP